MNQADDPKTETPPEGEQPAQVVNPPGSTVKLYRRDSDPVEVAKDSESHRIYLGRGYSEKEPDEEAGGSASEGSATTS